MARIASLAFALVFAGAALAQKAPAYSDSSGAIRGYASVENRDRFAAAPEKYAPQYGGYCAYGVASGYAVKIEPEAWSVVDGKLYLNYDRSVQKTWQSDVPGYLRKAEANWPRVLAK